MASYDPRSIEPKWQQKWLETNAFRANDASDKPTYFVLDMFPYPSGAGLHVGHPEGYTATDIISRKKRMEGMNVLHPMGWDAFGLPAENYAIKTNIHPDISTHANIKTFKQQIQSLGFSYDWEREFATCDAEYYRFTQWWFLFLYRQGLAHKKNAPVNWCESCKTVLANEQVENGKCERCKNDVVQKNMNQWFFKITDFVDDQRTAATPGRVVLLHGFDGTPTDSYFAWLRNELEARGYIVETPQLPNAAHPKADEWLAALDALHLDEHTIVVGHSLGAAIILRWLEIRRKKLAKVVVTSVPFTNVGIDEITEICALPVSAAIRTLAEFEIIHSTDDHLVPTNEAEKYAELLSVPLRRVDGYKHFDKTMKPAEVLGAITTRVTRGLISGLDAIDWPESTKTAQRNWIGRSEGAEIDFEICHPEHVSRSPGRDSGEGSAGTSDSSSQAPQNDNPKLTVFTTRPDTIFGVTFLVLAPEHPLVASLTTDEQRAEVEAYVATTKKKSDLDRQAEKEKTGAFTGTFATNPFSDEKMPVWIADYVLMGYGTGAIMAVPAHDERDFAFAKKYDLDIRTVVGELDDPFQKNGGRIVNSHFLDGLTIEEAIARAINELELKKVGARKTTIKLRDWLVSRQRYWGAPIPIIHCEACGEVPVPESELPVRLPTDVDFVPTGESPLVHSKTFHDVACPKCGAAARRESDTMDTFVCSSWYYFAFAEAAKLKAGGNPMTDHSLDEIVNNPSPLAPRPSPLAKWLPVDLYVGGAEHTVLHLLYARFFTKVAHRAGLIDVDEPFAKLRHQGMILAEDGRKMSKSLGNVINPDEVVHAYGADTLRMYEMFMGPFADSVPWNTKGIEGIHRFLQKVWRVFTTKKMEMCGEGGCPTSATPDFKRMLHTTIKKVTEDTDDFKFNTAVSQMMIFVNYALEQDTLPQPAMEKFLKLLAPYAPHIVEELWHELGHETSIHAESWPMWNEKFLAADTITIVVQVNGKVRDQFEAPAGIAQADAFTTAHTLSNVQKWLEGKEIIKEIFVPNKIVGFVVR